jgi:hypothetical protein
MSSAGIVSASVICGTAAGGFTFVFVRLIVRLFTNWSNTTPPHVAGKPCSFAAIRKADRLAAISARYHHLERMLLWAVLPE